MIKSTYSTVAPTQTNAAAVRGLQEKEARRFTKKRLYEKVHPSCSTEGYICGAIWSDINQGFKKEFTSPITIFSTHEAIQDGLTISASIYSQKISVHIATIPKWSKMDEGTMKAITEYLHYIPEHFGAMYSITIETKCNLEAEDRAIKTATNEIADVFERILLQIGELHKGTVMTYLDKSGCPYWPVYVNDGII